MSVLRVLSARKLRVIAIIGGILVLIYVFTRHDEQSIQQTSQPEESTQHNALSATDPTSCPAPTVGKTVDWSEFAYVQYVTDPHYLCNSLMIFEALRRYGTRADLLMLYPHEWDLPTDVVDDKTSPIDYESFLITQARDQYSARLKPIGVMTYENEDDETWQDSYTKFLAWNQTQYKRVIALDSDGTLLDHMDELFLLPTAPVAMPRAYWMDRFFLASQLIVIEPSEHNWQRVKSAMEHHEGHDYDMDILNKVFSASALVIPHRRYGLLTGEFHHQIDQHEAYLGSSTESWNAKDAVKEAKFVHFSDWPLPKPWLKATEAQAAKQQPLCRSISEGALDCTDRDVWLELRKDFSERRLRICGKAYDNIH